MQPSVRARRRPTEASGVRVRPVDLRDQTLEFDDPHYRVYVWIGSSTCDEWELTETDLDEVLTWVSQNANGRTYSL